MDSLGCWIWKHGKGGDGRPIVSRFRDFPEHASRLAYRLFKGPISGHILHSCDVKTCVNPEHLIDGTHAQNMQEAWDRSPGLKAERKIRSARMKKIRKDPEFERKRYIARHLK